MSGKLDQSLDELTKAQRRSSQQQNRRNPRRSATKPAAPTAPAGGITKAKKGPRAPVAKAAQPKAAPPRGDSKIIVSNLPKDVSEQQIKEYFVQSVGPIKKVELQYGPNSQSRGIANVSFHKPEGASNAFQKLNGLLVDSRPIKIEIVVGASQADRFIPAAKTLAERTTQPKAKPKSAATDKKKINEAKAKAVGGAKPGQNKKRGRSARPTKKTEAELDSEMADYFVAAPAASNENAPAPAANGEAMDEIM